MIIIIIIKYNLKKQNQRIKMIIKYKCIEKVIEGLNLNIKLNLTKFSPH